MQRIPDFDRVIPGDPDFIAEIAGVSSTRDVHRNACDLAMSYAKIFQVRDVGFGYGLQQTGGSRSLQRERRYFLGNIINLYVHVQAVLPEPAQAGIGGGPA